MDDEYTTCVALLHDVLEASFPTQVIEAIRVLTHSKDIAYFDYINKVKNNAIARKVKIADLKHNSDLSRLKEVSDDDLKRMDKYKNTLLMLLDN